jgi:anti-sigma-K factor RskA
MSPHPSREEDFDLYALGVLEGEERSAIEAHMSACAECARKLADAQGRIALLALAAPQAEPSPEVKQRLLRRVHGSGGAGGFGAADAGSMGGGSAAPARMIAMPARVGGEAMQSSAKPAGQWVSWVLAAAAVALLVISSLLWKQNDHLQGEVEKLRADAKTLHKQLDYQRLVADVMEGPNVLNVALRPMPGMPKGDAMVHYNPAKGKLVYDGWIEPVPSDKSYQLWVVPMDGNPISVGVFNPVTEDPASWIASVPEGIQAKAFAITLEPAGGENQPTGPQVLVGSGT